MSFDYSGYDQRNWGGYDEEPISSETVGLAKALHKMLRDTPCDAPGGDGSIGFEWRNGDDILCLDVMGSSFRVYGRIGGKHLHSGPISQ
jgi:hypothetical protein